MTTELVAVAVAAVIESLRLPSTKPETGNMKPNDNVIKNKSGVKMKIKEIS